MLDRAALGPLITSRNNARVKALRGALSGRVSRAGDLLGLEGPHLLGEAHRSGLSLETVFLREGSEVLLSERSLAQVQPAEWALLSRDVFDSAVGTESPQGIAATWVIREPVPPAKLRGLVLVLDEVQDPGNVGTLIRSAEAFGGQAVMVTPRTAYQWNPKVVRASAGSVFRMPVVRAPITEIADRLRAQGMRVFAAVAGFTGEHHLAAPHGVVTGRVDNAEASDPYRYADEVELGVLGGGYAASLAYDADFLQPCAILVGNEGAGLSAEALACADERVQIPCSVESLNAAVAGSVLLYEAMRQVPLRVWAQRQGLRP